MKKLESSFKNMVISLTCISIVVAGLLAFVFIKTEEPIERAANEKQEKAIREVTPEFSNNPTEEKFEVEIAPNDLLTVFPAKQDGKLVGIAVETNTQKGFSGEIKIMVGFDKDGNIVNYSVLKQKETPGLGTKIVDWFKPAVEKEKSLVENLFGFEVKAVERKSSVIGKNPECSKLTVSKDGGEIDAITAATITSRAFLDAINRAYTAYTKVMETQEQEIVAEQDTDVNQ